MLLKKQPHQAKKLTSTLTEDTFPETKAATDIQEQKDTASPSDIDTQETNAPDKRLSGSEQEPTDKAASSSEQSDSEKTKEISTQKQSGKKKQKNKPEKEITARSIISWSVFTFFLTILLLIAIGFIILNAKGYRILNVETGSMEPNLPVNSLIFVKPTPPEEIQAGDIITYTMNENGVLATHRVKFIRKSSRQFVTRGDANNTDDPAISWDNVVGKVVLHIPGIGGVFQTLTAPENRGTIILSMAALVVVVFAWDYIMGRRKRKRLAARTEASAVDSSADEKNPGSNNPDGIGPSADHPAD